MSNNLETVSVRAILRFVDGRVTKEVFGSYSSRIVYIDRSSSEPVRCDFVLSQRLDSGTLVFVQEARS